MDLQWRFCCTLTTRDMIAFSESFTVQKISGFQPMGVIRPSYSSDSLPLFGKGIVCIADGLSIKFAGVSGDGIVLSFAFSVNSWTEESTDNSIIDDTIICFAL